MSYFGDEESESGHLIFIKGKNDWNVEIESANVATDEFSTGDRVDIVLYYSEQGNESEDAADEDSAGRCGICRAVLQANDGATGKISQHP